MGVKYINIKYSNLIQKMTSSIARKEEYNMSNWLNLYDSMGDFLAPSMAKDHPNIPIVKEEGCYYYGVDGKKYLDFYIRDCCNKYGTSPSENCSEH